VESQVQVPVASESTYKTNCTLRVSAICFQAPVASGPTPAEPPTMVRPPHRLGLVSLRCQHSRTDTSSTCRRAAPTSRVGPSSCILGVSTPAPSCQPGLGTPRRSNMQATSTPPAEEDAPATAGAPTSHRTRRDRHAALVHQGQDRFIDHVATVTATGLGTPPPLTKCHVAIHVPSLCLPSTIKESDRGRF